MNSKRIGTILMSVVLATAIGTTAWAVTQDTDTASDGTTTQTEERIGGPRGAGKAELTDEQKAEMEAKRAEMEAAREAQQEAWAALSDAEKETIYSLKEEIAGLEDDLIDQYLEYGLIDEDTATELKEENADKIAQMRESDEMPMLQRGGDRGGMGGEGPCKPDEDTTDTDASST